MTASLELATVDVMGKRSIERRRGYYEWLAWFTKRIAVPSGIGWIAEASRHVLAVEGDEEQRSVCVALAALWREKRAMELLFRALAQREGPQ